MKSFKKSPWTTLNLEFFRLVGVGLITKFGSLLFFGYATLITRRLDTKVYSTLFSCIAVGQILLTIDMGIGMTIVTAVSRGVSTESTLASLAERRKFLHRSFLCCFPFILLGEYLVFTKGEADSRDSLTVVLMLLVQSVLVLIGIRCGPYERILFARNEAKNLVISSSFSIVGGLFLLYSSTLSAEFAAVFCAAAFFAVSSLSRVWSFFAVSNIKLNLRRRTNNQKQSVGSLGKIAGSFWILQLCGMVSFGIDQFVVAVLRSPQESANFAAHARYFTLGSSLMALVSTNLLPPLSAALERGESVAARTLSRVIGGAIGLLCIAWSSLFLLKIVPLSIFRTEGVESQSLSIALSVWFVLSQLGVVLAQIQAALLDLEFQVKVAVRMAVLNLVCSLIFCRLFGAIGVVYGSVIPYALLVFVPVSRRLFSDDLWAASTSGKVLT
jgi:hypothetical protein